MLGTNQKLPQDLNDGQSLHVQEVFYTLQGEGQFTGRPSVFIRLAGCNLSCYWCDTEFDSSKWQPSLTELLEQVAKLRPPHCNLAVITGGEPFRQNIASLVEHLLQRNFTVEIETNGLLWVDLPEDPRVHIVCSPKSAYIHPQIASRARTFKYVVAAGAVDRNDGLPVVSTQRAGHDCRIARPPHGARVYVMPLDELDDQRNAANLKQCVDVAQEYGHILTLQTQKIAGFR